MIPFSPLPPWPIHLQTLPILPSKNLSDFPIYLSLGHLSHPWPGQIQLLLNCSPTPTVATSNPSSTLLPDRYCQCILDNINSPWPEKPRVVSHCFGSLGSLINRKISPTYLARLPPSGALVPDMLPSALPETFAHAVPPTRNGFLSPLPVVSSYSSFRSCL